jgi:hypothetical protein
MRTNIVAAAVIALLGVVAVLFGDTGSHWSSGSGVVDNLFVRH